jgi:hypothetical protein
MDPHTMNTGMPGVCMILGFIVISAAIMIRGFMR